MIYGIACSDGTKLCQSSLPYLSYSLDVLKDLEKAGYILLIDGKRTRFPSAAQHKAAINGGRS